MGHASPSRLRDALDLSIADPADSQILDDRAVQEILETGSYPLLDPSTGNSRHDKDKVAPPLTDVPDHNAPTNETDSAGKDAGYYGATSAIQVRKARAMLEEITEGARALHHYRPEAARVSWVRLLLNWFMSRFWQSDLR